jgi:hypothetical protein
MVKKDEIEAVVAMRVCRSTFVAVSDEDGPIQPMTAYCVEQAGHGPDHSNGYFRWSDR